MKPLVGGEGFTGDRQAGGKNRWSGHEHTVVPLLPQIVAEVEADHITGDHFRHGGRVLKWREDKRLEDCTMDQIEKS
jgi:ATP-dependent DNA ligase